MNIPDINLKMFSFRLKFLSRCFNSENNAKWKDTMQYFVSKLKNLNLGNEIVKNLKKKH